MTFIRRMYIGAITVLIGITLSLVLALINVMLIARLLGPISFGHLSTLLALCGIMLIPTDFGGESATAKFISEQHFSIKKIISTSFSLRLSISLICITLYSLTLIATRHYWGLDQELWILYLFIAPFLLLSESLLLFNKGVFQGLKRMDLLAFFEFSWRGLQLLLCVSLIMIGLGIVGASIGYGLASLIVFFIGMHYFPKKWWQKPEKSVARSFFNFSTFAFISLSMGIIILYTDTLCIAYFRTPDEVAYYSIAAKASFFVTIIPVAIGAILYPMVSEKHGCNDVESTCKLYLTSIRTIFYSAGLVAVLLLLSSTWLIDFFLPSYRLALPALFVLVFAYFFWSFGYSYTSVLNGWNTPHILAKISTVIAVFNVCTNILLVPKYGYISAAFTSLASFILGSWMGFRAVRKLTGAHVTLSTFIIRMEDLSELKEAMKYMKKKLTSNDEET